MKTLDKIKSKCHGMLLRKDLSDFVRTDYDREYYEGYIQALQWVQGQIQDLILDNVTTDHPFYDDDDYA
jgi:hypothetical protein